VGRSATASVRPRKAPISAASDSRKRTSDLAILRQPSVSAADILRCYGGNLAYNSKRADARLWRGMGQAGYVQPSGQCGCQMKHIGMRGRKLSAKLEAEGLQRRRSRAFTPIGRVVIMHGSAAAEDKVRSKLGELGCGRG